MTRFLHRRGFGVHSPLAFSLITQTLRRGKEQYYAYDRLERMPRPALMKTLMRVLCRFAPRRVSADTPETRAVAALCSHGCVTEGGFPDFMVRAQAPTAADLEAVGRGLCPVLLLDPGAEVRRWLESTAADSCLVLSARHYVLAVPHDSPQLIRL